MERALAMGCPSIAISRELPACKASRLTGTSFQYLLATARVESNLNPSAAAKTSSAGGLFQFIEQTWLGTLKDAGPSLGYGRYADAISQTRSGRFVVSDPQLRAQIMALRQDPTANALMAGAFTQTNAAALSQKLGELIVYNLPEDIIGVDEEVAHKDSCLMEHLMSGETRERFFNFMKSLCSDDFKKRTFSTSFDFSQFEHQHDFEEIQKGDTYLKTE